MRRAPHVAKWERTVTVIGCHVAGEENDVIVGGVLPPPGAIMFERGATSRAGYSPAMRRGARGRHAGRTPRSRLDGFEPEAVALAHDAPERRRGEVRDAHEGVLLAVAFEEGAPRGRGLLRVEVGPRHPVHLEA